MTISLFGQLLDVIGGIFIGTLFGFLLQKAGVTQVRTIKNQLLLKDFTVMKVILTAIATGSLGLYGYRHFIEHKELIISTTTLPSAFFGGAIFGIGMATLGFCPGTCIGALAEKSKAAVFGLIGMVSGAFLYSQIAGFITEHFKPKECINKSTLSETFNVSPFVIILAISAFVIVMWAFDKGFHKKRRA